VQDGSSQTMGSKKDLTEGQRGSIIYGYLRKDSVRAIAAAVGCGRSSVYNVIKKFRESSTLAPKNRPGRPRILTPLDRANLKSLVTNGNRRLNIAQITNLFNIQSRKKKTPVSKSTVRRALHDENLKSCVVRPKPFVSPENTKKRLDWCLAHKDWSIRRFRHVLWSDETTVCLFLGSPGRAWRESHEKWDIECLNSTVKRSPGRMYWGCFSWYGVGPLIPLNSTATGASHVDILQRYVLPALENFEGRKDCRPFFQQDNARPHTAKVAMQFINENRIRTMDWPPQSPDLNPIENLWAEVKKSVLRKPKPSNLSQLDILVKQAWYDIPPEYCRKLIMSMPDRVTACIRVGGKPTKY
jgi:transposase